MDTNELPLTRRQLLEMLTVIGGTTACPALVAEPGGIVPQSFFMVPQQESTDEIAKPQRWPMSSRSLRAFSSGA
jgi:hypothetical protein